MPWLELRFDYNTTTIRLRPDYAQILFIQTLALYKSFTYLLTYRASASIRRQQKTNMSIFRRNRCHITPASLATPPPFTIWISESVRNTVHEIGELDASAAEFVVAAAEKFTAAENPPKNMIVTGHNPAVKIISQSINQSIRFISTAARFLSGGWIWHCKIWYISTRTSTADTTSWA